MEILRYVSGLNPSREISVHDRMFSQESEQHYFYVGRSDLLAILNILNIRASYHDGDSDVRDILDFGCGHGRVTRWLRAAFPDTRIYVTDLDHTATKWCVNKFQCSEIDGSKLPFQFDLVWLGSVFTHLPEHIAAPLVQRLLTSLRPNGVLVFTTQGRYSVERMNDFDWKDGNGAEPNWMHYGLGRDGFQSLT